MTLRQKYHVPSGTKELMKQSFERMLTKILWAVYKKSFLTAYIVLRSDFKETICQVFEEPIWRE